MHGRRRAVDVLLIDDEASLRRTLRTALESMGHTVADAADGARSLARLRERPFDLAFLDLRLGRESGLDLLPELLREAPGLAVVLVSAYASVESAVEAMRRGAFDYLPKPFTPGQVRVVLDRWSALRRLRERVADLEREAPGGRPEEDFRTEDPAMRRVLDVAFRAAASNATVLIRGESGTGKGVLARALHARSPRAAGPFVTVHCPSLSSELLESELFGHARGAFTGAVRDTEGKVAAAEGGTLFLDEVGDLPPPLQPKLLRLLQERAYERVGEVRTRSSDARVLAATNRDLAALAEQGRFREDLYYRLNVIEVELPPLRNRPADVLPLARRLLVSFARQGGKPVARFTPEAEDAARRHPWPGNVRELRNAVERGVILADGPEVGASLLALAPAGKRVEVGGPVTLKELEAEHVRRILASSSSLEQAAATLGIDPSTLYRIRKRPGRL
jgi:two-component system, NtrC family, response regulator AlgB